jgi:hypothetical protein
MYTLPFRRLSMLITIVFAASLMIFVTGVFAQSATPAGETEITGVLESIGSGSIVVSGQTIDILNAEINDMLIVGSTVKVHVSQVNGVLTAREVETTAIVDDNTNTNANANANANANTNGNTNANSNTNTNSNANANSNTNSNDNVDDNGNDNVSGGNAVSAQQAIDIVLAVYPTTDILSIELTSKFGETQVWEVKIRNGIELNIDAQTGVILTIDRRGSDNSQNDNGNQNGNGNVNNNQNGNSNDNSDDHGGMGSDDNQNGNSNDNSDDHGGDNSGSGGMG